jgi:hypothetical protein
MIRNAAFPTILLVLSSLFGCGGDGDGGGGDTPPVADSIGAPCFTDSQCPAELFCSETSPTDVCAAECGSDAECRQRFGSQFACVNGESRCARSCISDSDCPDSECVGFTSGDSFCSN